MEVSNFQPPKIINPFLHTNNNQMVWPKRFKTRYTLVDLRIILIWQSCTCRVWIKPLRISILSLLIHQSTSVECKFSMFPVKCNLLPCKVTELDICQAQGLSEQSTLLVLQVPSARQWNMLCDIPKNYFLMLVTTFFWKNSNMKEFPLNLGTTRNILLAGRRLF